MTEKEKMLKQMLYDANYDKSLLEERARAKDLCMSIIRPVRLMKKNRQRL